MSILPCFTFLIFFHCLQGAQIFEAVGLAEEVIDDVFILQINVKTNCTNKSISSEEIVYMHFSLYMLNLRRFSSVLPTDL